MKIKIIVMILLQIMQLMYQIKEKLRNSKFSVILIFTSKIKLNRGGFFK